MDPNCNVLPANHESRAYDHVNTGNLISNSPTSKKLEVCTGCQRAIEDRFFLKVMANTWHEQCLQCCVCRLPLTQSCFFKDMKLYCKMDYDKLYGTKCNRCRQPIPPNGLVMRALDHVYHMQCFICVVCGHQLQKGEQFVMKDGQLLCRLDFEKEFAMLPLSPKSEEDSSLEDNESDSGTTKGPKRPRTILTTSQRRKFKASFEVNPKPCRKVRESLAAETGLSVRVVQVWFQNQRAKVKKIARRQNQDSSGGGLDSKGNQNKSQKRKYKDEDDLNGTENMGNINAMTPDQANMQNVPPMGDNPYTNHMGAYDSPPGHQGPMYTPNSLGESIYSPEAPISMENSLDNLDEMLLAEQAHEHHVLTSRNGGLINPIDKLYSMQDSYFSH
ncbi:LIM homeobox transcription factor 1-alpha isoform X1 [Lingula anatina]|uniref:LIM homeobox transcription factor 1-alpha isoform X1 n=2 Tax=Lingula anatina TaxID=7574 RepID=A0A1S3JXZ8_LINAN|nr:LIM homeobox transcription factor 1-alpha isoform X1 [Lingula anatina]|eukprot:XP_013415182.1 LIM homeobox transcription factor 1-alpha isoform X1 [Lingula anatina]